MKRSSQATSKSLRLSFKSHGLLCKKSSVVCKKWQLIINRILISNILYFMINFRVTITIFYWNGWDGDSSRVLGPSGILEGRCLHLPSTSRSLKTSPMSWTISPPYFVTRLERELVANLLTYFLWLLTVLWTSSAKLLWEKIWIPRRKVTLTMLGKPKTKKLIEYGNMIHF